jgi:colanic acid/amylovoran biosynthesis protein
MKVLVKAYTVQNLGDDLLLHLLFTRYPQITFEIEIGKFSEKYERCWSYPNVTINNSHDLFFRIQRKLGLLTVGRKKLKGYDAIVYLGGSIFMENPDNIILDRLFRKTLCVAGKNKIPVFVLNCNFGPYHTEKYRLDKQDCFARCRQVCFREQYSYRLFGHLPQATYAPDAVFSYHQPVQTEPGTLGISVIDLENRPTLGSASDLYDLFLDQIIQRHYKDGYRIVLFDFCTEEGDGKAAEKIALRHNEKNIETVHYNGELQAFLNCFLSMERLVVMRFHAMVLAAAHHIPFLPVVYSSKMSHVIEDLSLADSYIDLEHPQNPFGKLQFSKWKGDGVSMRQDVFGIFEQVIVKGNEKT